MHIKDYGYDRIRAIPLTASFFNRLLKDLNLTQNKLGKLLKVSRHSINKWSLGNRSMSPFHFFKIEEKILNLEQEYKDKIQDETWCFFQKLTSCYPEESRNEESWRVGAPKTIKISKTDIDNQTLQTREEVKKIV